MKFPDRVFAVGGAGKAIAIKLLESDWVIDGILEPRPNPTSLTITIIDTAEGEQNDDIQRIRDVREKIQKRQNELRDPEQGRTGSIKVEYKLITEDIRLSGSIDLLGEEAVPRIAAGNGIDEENWWIKEQHINENLDFAKGVVRKRGLGKAIYYKAYAEDDQISKYIDLPDKGKVAILAGLGGGTGSGIIMDLAKHLKQKQRTAEITLFGVLPNHTEGAKENTNAFAALSELEYLSLQDEQVFKDRILLPLDPTEFDGKTGNRIQTDKLLEEFDEAVVYLMASYYNTQNLEDPFADSPQYAPFTIGIPQILRFNVEAINEAREAFRDILGDKEEALEVEEEIYSEINRHLAKHFTDESGAGLRDLDKTDLNERLEQIEKLLNFDLFNELEYESVSIFSDIISDAREESSDVADQVETMSASIRAVDTTSGETGRFVDNIDEHLAEILEKDLRLLGQRKELLESIKVVDDNRIRDAIEYLIGSADTSGNPGVKLQRLEAKLEDLEDQRDSVEANLEETISELEEKRDEQSEEIKRRTNNWERDIEDEVSQLIRITEQDLENDLRTLRSHLDRFLSNVVNAESADEVEGISEAEIKQSLETIDTNLETIGIDFEEQRRAISGSLPDLKQARVAFLKMNQDESMLESVTPWESSTEEEKKQAHKDFRMQKNRLEDRGVFTVGPAGGNFSAELQFEEATTLNDVENRKRELQDDVLNALYDRTDEPREDLIRDLESELDGAPDRDRLREIAKQIFRIEVGETEEIEQRRDEYESELDSIESQIELYEPTISLFQQLNNKREIYQNNMSSFRSQQDNYADGTHRNVSTRSDEHAYIKNIQPNDVFRATGQDDIAQSDILSSKEESQRVQANLERLAKKARNEEYTGLKRRKLSKGRSRYGEIKVRVSVLSRAVNQMDSDMLEFEDIFGGAFDIGGGGQRVESPYTSWQNDIGGPWDIGLSVFITGVFTDNIRKVVQADGYHNGYQKREAEIGEDILVHHSYGLGEGFYVRRNNVMNMEDEEDVGFYLRDETEVVDDLLDQYVETISHN